MYAWIKRTADIWLSAWLLLFLLPLLIGIACWIRLTDGGPVLYRSKRLGKDGQPFDMLKFRTMRVGAPNWKNPDGSTYNAPDDPRLTRSGRILRESSLDELPQLWNVLRGNMSLVGPRPSGAEAFASFREDEQGKWRVRPGITGYTQAYYRNGLGVREKRLLDAWYAAHVSFRLDSRILLRTMKTVLCRENLYTCDRRPGTRR